jgi:hypothetical protein
MTNLFGATGNFVGRTPGSSNFLVWWDADPVRELLDSNHIDKYGLSGDTRLLTASGATSNNGTKSTPSLSADILGDWREEVIWRNTGNTELRIYTTTIPATNRLYTLMHDPKYRLDVAWQNVAYNQPPHPGFFLGAGMSEPPTPPIYTVQVVVGPGDYNTSGDVDAADYALWRKTRGSTADLRTDGSRNGVVDQADYEFWRANFGQTSAPEVVTNVAAQKAIQAPSAVAATQTVPSSDWSQLSTPVVKSAVVVGSNKTLAVMLIGDDDTLLTMCYEFGIKRGNKNATGGVFTLAQRDREETIEVVFEQLALTGMGLEEDLLPAV